jgi:transcription-repair coupling factor (superfamily II helicase)
MAGVETIKQNKQEITIMLSEDGSSRVDGQKIFKVSNKYRRQVGLGMEGKKLKMVIQTKGLDQNQWFAITFEMVKGLHDSVKEENSVS